jgi:hypothetical protein
MRHLALSALETRSVSIKRRADMGRRGEYLALFFGSRAGHVLVRLLSRIVTPRGLFQALFDKYAPDVVFATDVQNDFDIQLMHETHRKGVALLGMVRSWDNLTIKGLVRIVPDVLLVQNRLTKDDAIRFHDINEAKIRIVGIPHYDGYIQEKKCERESVHPDVLQDKKIILYVATGDRYINNNTIDCDVLDVLAAHLHPDEVIVVRLPIADTMNCLGGQEKYKTVYFDQVDKNRFARRKFVEISKKDDEHLQNLLRCCEIVVTGPSTMCIDAALFDKPVILVGFNGKGQRTYYNSIARYYDYNHFLPILASKGVWYVESEREMVESLESYRKIPSLHAEGRKKIIQEQTAGLMGNACERLADELVRFLK